jgi:exopolyphosphatase/guanosine-5'-triphosphate,3'-diphosphate pyrophosphatase
MRFSSIDLGTNTCLLLIAEKDETSREITRVVSDHSTIVRLGQGVDAARTLHPDAMERTLAALRKYSALVRAAGLAPEQTLAVATSQARDAQNGAEFFARVHAETGFSFRVISGEEEARLTFLGALLPGMDPTHCMVIDIGGGSTEVISERGAESIDIGSVRFTERYLKSDPVRDDEFWACQAAIDEELSKLQGLRAKLPSPFHAVATAGTATTLAAYFLELEKFDARAIDGLVLSRGDVHRQVEELKWRTLAERRKLRGIDSARADVILAGAMILWRAMEVLELPSIQVSTRGLRFGVIQDRLTV